MTCQPPSLRDSSGAFGVAQAAQHDGGQHEQIARERTCVAVEQGKARYRCTPEAGEEPEHRLRPLASAKDAEDSGGQWQKADEDNGAR